MFPTRRSLLLALAVAAVAGYGWMRFSAEPAAPRYLTAPVTRADLEETVLATGTLKPVRLVAVGSQASGRITSIKVKLGDTVKTGDLIAEIDSTTQANSLKTARASLDNVKAQLAEKQATLESYQKTLARQKAIYTSQAGSQADLQTAETNVRTTEAQIAALNAQIISAEIAVGTAEVELGYTRITAPMDGTILSIVNLEGRTVNASQSIPTIVIMGDLTTMTVRAEISEADIPKVKPGQHLRFNLIGDRATVHEATLEAIEPAPESITSDSAVSSSTTTSSSSSSSSSSSAIYYIGTFNVPNPDGKFRTYMSAEVNIVLGAAKGVLTIPSSALGTVDKDGHTTVRVVDADGKAGERAVTVGLNNKIAAEVRDGLNEGEHVVISQASASKSSSNRPGPPMGF
ncbi:membrane fusion protein, macrolide-specific efflux system [Rhizobium sp. RU35A]|uniref:Efflux RND transporter periplasmic adaptor subunit n=1 Tax=Rhizobium straminoryzae TaxID=1387186 RepID=A0A549T0F7_9HYPH|nr:MULTISPECIES: efflux RND transporter periplasmic adaptor subunit [Rhizobium]TRL35357.1 efflux RND transporter periplasmic adaptor subunit [Rhizobium straminoryzae]SIQ10754.1 membrane fusion protein, macrolide-specific efflux system [Rhizobium sp. RU35A]